LALSAALGLSLQLIVLWWLMRRDLGAFQPEGWWRDALKVILAAAAAVIVAGLLAGQLSVGPALLVLLASGTLGGLVYLLILRVLEECAW
jgi:peptidoglycan biosynthesis protein MviN/MurJ (putative lipid II flippase)